MIEVKTKPGVTERDEHWFWRGVIVGLISGSLFTWIIIEALK